MKGLLHSKRFKKNLRKWLFMYAGVMLLLTTVITYSKYMTSIQSKDEARPSKFDIKIEPITCPTPTDDDKKFCKAEYSTTSKCRPSTVVTSCFRVDTSVVEVSSDVWLTFDQPINKGDSGGYYVNESDDSISKLFDIEGIDIIENQETTFKEIYSNNVSFAGWTVDNKLNLPNRIKIKRTMSATETNRIWTIRVRAKYVDDDNNSSSNKDSLPLVKVGYIMQQITGSSSATKEGDEY